MRISPLICTLLLSVAAFAEGSRELAPNANIDITGNMTTDVASLHIGNAIYNNFAVYANPDPNSRLYIHIADPDKECIFLGFTFGHINQTSQNPPRIDFEYRLVDPNGNVVFGPVQVLTTDGNIQNWSEANIGPMQIYGAGGYDATQVSSADLTSQGWSGAGDYYIEFDFAGVGSGLLIDFWDFSVADCSQSMLVEKKGRVWSYNWSIFAINDFGFPNRPFNGAYFVCAPDPDNPAAAFITKIDFNGAGFRPAAFNVAFNSFGSMNSGNVMADRRSVEAINATQSEYPVFLNDPVDLCETAEAGEIELLGVSRCGAGDFCIKYIASKEGQIDLLLDFDGPDDVYTPGTADVMLAVDVAANEVGVPSCVFWDGLDGLGNPLVEDAATAIPVVISYAQGIYHFPIYDAEFMTEGFMIQAVRPMGSQPLLYYDDSQISIASGSGEPSVQLTGCMPPCHRWTVFNDPNVPGFGNLNTINSWWFSQRILRSAVFFLPAYLQCSIIGPDDLCEGESATLTWEPGVSPEGGDIPEILSVTWSGPDIVGSNMGSAITIGNAGNYSVDILWLTQLGDTCETNCIQEIASKPISFGSIDTLIVTGEVIEINGEEFSEGGQFVQVLTGSNGCDSILTIKITLLQTAVYFSLDDCSSFTTLGTDTMYNEFTPVYPEPISCAAVEATIAYRDNPGVNKHSCTPGVEDSPAICISSLDACEYVAGDEKSFIFSVTVTPAPDTAVAVTGLSFYERAPVMFDWISGSSGPNNYPTLYGVRILKDGAEIFRSEDIDATTDWTLEKFDFLGNEDFVVDTTTVFRFELLGYCLIGNGAAVAAWDLDEIRVQASCAQGAQMAGDISGRIFTEYGQHVGDVEILLSEDPAFDNPIIAMSDGSGVFMFSDNPAGNPYFLRAQKNTDFLEGVSTLDLIAIQKHLLGIRLFDSPMQYLAADATGNHGVSVLDLIDLRKLILGYYPELPGNTSWRFGKPGQDLPLTSPWDFDETIFIQSLATDMENLNFVGVKIGDVNRSLSGLDQDIVMRDGEALYLSMSDMPVHAGEHVRIDITSQDVVDLAGFQFALKFNNTSLVAVESGQLDMEHCYSYDATTGLLKVSWSQAMAQRINTGQRLFSLTLIAGQNGSTRDMLHLQSTALRNEAYLGDGPEIVEIQLHSRTLTQGQHRPFGLVNAPNPFSEETVLRFYFEEPGTAALSVTDVTGRELYRDERVYTAGEHAIVLRSDDVRSSGSVLFCHLTSQGNSETIKLMLSR